MNAQIDPALRRERLRYLLLTVVCLALLGGALYFQYVRHEDPCPLCILTRYALVLIAIFGLAGAVSRGWAGIQFARVLAALSAVGGMAASGYLIYVQANPLVSCGYDVVEAFVDALPTSRLLPQVFQVQGMCQTMYPPILGLTLPMWSLAAFVVIFLSLALHRPRRAISLR
ncbi:disulfide bond formation protein B [Pandoraea terrigena]|uniref:Disulfide bond formation protein B n=1 Tax=Pandoraea terrigena TaxID=2508292 RepID=A0A5E4XRZ1_9BURK|nr:disulfide bond formation protein B [Pandoraea terrigena]VVE39100.1 disulfide bond formation protein B [Pandoraea terrigena]